MSRREPLKRPVWVVAIASVVTAGYTLLAVVGLLTLFLGADPTGLEPVVWYLVGFALMLLGAPVAPSRTSRRNHYDRAPMWMWALVLTHAVLGAGCVAAAGAGLALPGAAFVVSLALASVSMLMAWFGDFEEQ